MTVDWGRYELELAEARLAEALTGAVVRVARRQARRRVVVRAAVVAGIAAAVQRARRPSPSE